MCKSSGSRIFLLAAAAIFMLTAMKTSVIDDLIFGAGQEADEEVVIDRAFSVQPGELLAIDVSHTDVVVRSGRSNEARVQAVLRGRDMDRARRFFDHLNFEVDYADGRLTVRTNPQGSWNGRSGNADIDVLITVPELFDADIAVSHGAFESDAMRGMLAFDIAHADFNAETFGGASMHLEMAHGDVNIARVLSQKVRMDLQHGDLDIDEVAGSNFDLSVAHGDVDIDGLSGYPRIDAQHGDVSIRLVDAQGGEFRAAHGDIDLTTARGTAADLDIDASDADIASELAFEGTRRDGRVQGRINGGGPRLTARTSHGDVTLRAN